MTRADVLQALKQRLAEIARVVPQAQQRQAIFQAHETADALLRRLGEHAPAGGRTWR